MSLTASVGEEKALSLPILGSPAGAPSMRPAKDGLTREKQTEVAEHVYRVPADE